MIWFRSANTASSTWAGDANLSTGASEGEIVLGIAKTTVAKYASQRIMGTADPI